MSSPTPIRLAVRLTPRGGRDAVDGWARDAAGGLQLKVRVSTPPVDGAANAALIRLVAKSLKLANGAVRIVSGDHSRVKVLELEGVGQADLEAAFGTPI